MGKPERLYSKVRFGRDICRRIVRVSPEVSKLCFSHSGPSDKLIVLAHLEPSKLIEVAMSNLDRSLHESYISQRLRISTGRE